MVQTKRPTLDHRLTGAELRRWYWLRSELVGLARELGVSPGGGKIVLTERLATVLDGGSAVRLVRATRAPQLAGPLSEDTAIPPGQRCTQQLRAFFVDRLGPGFRFDAAMRDFIAAGDRTLGEAVAHWQTTRSDRPRPIGPQFELNRFSREWSAAHPAGSRSELLDAWRRHRALPVDARLPVSGDG